MVKSQAAAQKNLVASQILCNYSLKKLNVLNMIDA